MSPAPATRPHGAPPDLAADAWRLLLGYFHVHRERTGGILDELGLSLGDMRTLTALDDDTPRPMGSLADDWACDASNATWMVDRLEQRGLVERRVLPTDRRVKAVVLTPAGAEVKAELLRRLHEPPPELRALPPADQAALRDLLAKLHPPD